MVKAAPGPKGRVFWSQSNREDVLRPGFPRWGQNMRERIASSCNKRRDAGKGVRTGSAKANRSGGRIWSNVVFVFARGCL
jgi:hypothetical protein